MTLLLGAFPGVISTAEPNPAPVDHAVSTASDVISSVFDALGNNGYQTGISLIVATIAVVAMGNIGTHIVVKIVVGIGAFWAGWLGYNTLTGENHQLLPSDVGATKLWDIALTSPANFLLVVGVGCVAAIFLWRSALKPINRLVLMLGAVLGASLIYNLYEAFSVTTA